MSTRREFLDHCRRALAGIAFVDATCWGDAARGSAPPGGVVSGGA